MTLFNFLFLGHLVGDYLFQTRWMAMNKSTKWPPLIVHCLIYTAALILFSSFYGILLPLGAISLVFISHIFLDRRTFVVWWVRQIMGTPDAETSWLTIVCDQIFHLLIIGVVVYFWYWFLFWKTNSLVIEKQKCPLVQYWTSGHFIVNRRIL